MRIAVAEPYYGGSHRAWADGYRDTSTHEVELLTHEARFWKWRMQGSFVTLADQFRAAVAAAGPFDVILAGDMLHLPGFLGAIGSHREGASVALYMHENQLSYPLSPRDAPDESYPMINWTSMTVADAVYFNSRYHLDSWFEGAAKLLRRFPDYRHESKLPDVAARSEVLPVGVDLARLDSVSRVRAGPPTILWNHRWDFDKRPGRFLEAIESIADQADFRLILTGEWVTEFPDLQGTIDQLGDRIDHLGFADDRRYAELLGAADIVVSTAAQEFFGISVTEAIYSGAFPLLPDRLVYPERIPPEFHDSCLYAEPDLEEKLLGSLRDLDGCRRVAESLRAEMARYDWTRIAVQYDDKLTALHGAAGKG